MHIGVHVSAAGGLHLAADRARDMGCESFQVFTKSQLQWSARPLEADDVILWFDSWQQNGLLPCLVHDSYLINLSSPDAALRRKSVEAFTDELERAAVLGIPWVNTHPGSHRGSGEAAGLSACAESLRECLSRTEGSEVRGILLKTTAGQGNDLGCRFEHLASLLDACGRSSRMGVCLDTCHIFAAGYNLCSEESYDRTFSEFDRLIGLGSLKAFHLNDSKFPLGSRRDRHAEIGAGHIGAKAFGRLVSDERFAELPGILELPDENGETERSLALLKRLRRQP